MTATAPAIDALTIRFEFEDCTRCGGTGHFSFNMMEGTICRRCRGRKRTITRRGNTAYTRWKEQIDARLSTPVVDLKPGDVVYSDASNVAGMPVFYPTRWRTVVRIERTDHGDSTSLTVVFRARNGEERVHGNCVPADQLDTFTVPRLDRALLKEINRKIARRFIGAWLGGEEPPAPRIPRTRPSTSPEDRAATAYQLRTLHRLAEDLEAGPLKEEAAAFQENPGTFAAASDLNGRVVAEVEAQRKRHIDRQRYAGPVGAQASVTGTVIRRRTGSWGVLLVVQDDAAEVTAVAFTRSAAAHEVAEQDRVTLTGTVTAHETGWNGRTKETKLRQAHITPA
ncbi:hypothetical protein AB0D90_03470 [Streptomyces althioticus]|uniref:hypothetical protein n=1 Tax=Streptomyces althioticus TaxID=83380 RepID=UPI0033C640C7